MIKKIFEFLKKTFWVKPTKPKKKKKTKIPAAEISETAYVILTHNGKEIQLQTNQVAYFNSLNGRAKRQLVNDFQIKIKKGKIKKVTIDGVPRYVKTRGYDYSKHFPK